MRAPLSLAASCALACLSAAPSAAADASERILRFASAVEVHADGSMTVTEQITVRSAGEQIRHGIYRDLPTTYRDAGGTRYVVDLEVVAVSRDGQPEPYRARPQGNGIRIYIGRDDAFVPLGVHAYSLVYATARQLGFFPEHDELYWNVTGNGWVFPIDEAVCTVRLPAAVPRAQLRWQAYTGPQGVREQDAEATILTDGSASFRATRPLDPGEGLTIVVGWPKGLVREPTLAQRTGWLLRDNRSFLVGLLGVLALLLYYWRAWALVGRDPPKGSIMPYYEPPDGCSPAAMRFLARMGFDHKAFTAALLNLAVKGVLTIREEHGRYTLVRTRPLSGRAGTERGGGSALAPEEEELAHWLLGTRERVELYSSDQTATLLSTARDAAARALRRAHEPRYFVTNRRYVLLGLAGSGLIALAAFASDLGSLRSDLIWIAGSLGVMVLAGSWSDVRRLGVGWAGLLGIVLLGWVLDNTRSGDGGGSLLGWIVLTVVLALVNMVFVRLLRAFTPSGRARLDQIEGFKMFLAATEQDRLRFLHPPDKTPELFERCLPYALALDVEQRWAEQFAGVLDRAGEAPGSYAPSWYSGGDWHPASPGRFAFSLGQSLTGAISAASTPPGSSSGFGGGGSSGGGGGGGGGGGW